MRLAALARLSLVLLAVGALPAFATDAAARGLTADDKQMLKQYHLSLDTADRCIAAYREAIAEPAPKQEFAKVRSKASDKTLTQIIKSYDTDYPATSAALKKRNCQPRDFVLSTSVMAYARLVNQARQEGKATQGFDFVTPENLATYDKNQQRFAALTAELQQLVTPSAPAGGNRRR